MSLAWPYQPEGCRFHSDGRLSFGRNSSMGMRSTAAITNYNCNYDNLPWKSKFTSENNFPSFDFSRNLMLDEPNYDRAWPDIVPSAKRRKVLDFSCETTGRPFPVPVRYENGLQHIPPQILNSYWHAPLICSNTSGDVAAARNNNAAGYNSTTCKRDRSKFEDDEEVGFVSRDEIERCSPSRKDGIDVLHETHLRYSYCAFLQNVGFRLDLPQTTIGTAMVLCHRFFLRRSHASHDRFLIATAVLFLASKSEESARPLNDVLKVSCEVFHKQQFSILYYMLPLNWFEQYRERIIEAEQLVLTTLNFELSVQHPYESLTSTLQKLGFSQSVLVNLALSLVSEGLRSSLWLQFKPHQIAAGAAYLAAKFLNMNFSSCHNIWCEFHTPPSVLRDVAHQLMELF